MDDPHPGSQPQISREYARTAVDLREVVSIMIAGLVAMIAATIAYNGSTVLLAVGARRVRAPLGARLFVGIFRQMSGVAGLGLTVTGWALEVLALTRIPLTVSKAIYAAGLGLLLLLARRALHEPVIRHDLLGGGAVALGMVLVALTPPTRATSAPSSTTWLLVALCIIPFALAPFVLRLAQQAPGPMASAVASGVSFAGNGIMNLGVALYLAPTMRLAPLSGVLVGVVGFGLLGFTNELDALKYGRASTVIPVILGLQSTLPILVAPLVFGERWPTGNAERILLAIGLGLAMTGIVTISRSSADVLS